jgi:hypothetical protein
MFSYLFIYQYIKIMYEKTSIKYEFNIFKNKKYF